MSIRSPDGSPTRYLLPNGLSLLSCFHTHFAVMCSPMLYFPMFVFLFLSHTAPAHCDPLWMPQDGHSRPRTDFQFPLHGHFKAACFPALFFRGFLFLFCNDCAVSPDAHPRAHAAAVS